MKTRVIGVTTEYTSIAKILGVENETDYGLYQETQMGKYYARILPDGTFEEKVVRLISYEQATNLEAIVVASIDEISKNIQKIIDSAPVINWEHFNKRVVDIEHQIKAKAEGLGKELKSSLEEPILKVV